MLDWTLSELAGRVSFFGICFLNLVQITMGISDDRVELDTQVKLKLAVLSLAGSYGLWRLYADPRLLPALFRGPMLFFSATTLMLFLASATSLTPVVSLVSSGSACVTVVVTVALMLEIGSLPAAGIAAMSAVCFVIGSWYLYLFVPEQGVFREPLPGGAYFERMGGLAHPNSLGQMSGLAILLLYFTGGNLRRRVGLLYWGLLALSAAALVMSASRTSLLAIGLALLFGLRVPLRQAFFRWRMDLLAVPGLLLVIAWGAGGLGAGLDDRLTSRFSKSGESEELTSLTGRSAIWAHTLRLVEDRPLNGYGMATSKELLQDYSLYTHNMVLNVALSAGFFAAGCLVLALAMGLAGMVMRPSALPDAVFVFLLLNGVTENVIFEFLASTPTACMAMVLAWRNIGTDGASRGGPTP